MHNRIASVRLISWLRMPLPTGTSASSLSASQRALSPFMVCLRLRMRSSIAVRCSNASLKAFLASLSAFSNESFLNTQIFHHNESNYHITIYLSLRVNIVVDQGGAAVCFSFCGDRLLCRFAGTALRPAAARNCYCGSLYGTTPHPLFAARYGINAKSCPDTCLGGHKELRADGSGVKPNDAQRVTRLRKNGFHRGHLAIGQVELATRLPRKNSLMQRG